MLNNFQFFNPPKSLDKSLKDLKTKSAIFWERQGDTMAIKLFKFIAKNVPAYQKLLKEHGINPNSIKSVADFKKLPITDKDTYLRKFKFSDLLPYRDFSKITTFSATSGSTGESFYFPRGEEHDAQYAYVAELFLRNQFEIDQHKTLGIIGFGLGIWIMFI